MRRFQPDAIPDRYFRSRPATPGAADAPANVTQALRRAENDGQ
jgi:hypothetical protein